MNELHKICQIIADNFPIFFIRFLADFCYLAHVCLPQAGARKRKEWYDS